MALAAASSGQRTLVISTDPAPSLGDALGARLSGTPRRIRIPGLDAAEIDASRTMTRWLRSRRGVLQTIALRGTWLDADDVKRLLRLSLPGIDEITALLEIARLARSVRYDTIIVDTAPTGHTLRMLSLPDTLAGVARAFDRMQAKHRVIVETLGGAWRPDAADRLIDELDRDARGLTEMLADPSRTQVSLVTLPEPMSSAETLDAVAALAARGIGVARVIVNRVTPPPERACAWCRARRTYEHRAIAALVSALRRRRARLSLVAEREREAVGVAALTGIARDIDRVVTGIARLRGSARGTTARPSRATGSAHTDALDAAARDARLLMFGGKGGVGKTTCAAAFALHTAGRLRDRRILLISVDPAHSLADALGTALSDVPRRIPGGPRNLDVREMDAAAGLERLRTRHAAAMDEVFERLGGSGIDTAHDRRVMRDLIELSPPGLDELVAILDVTDAVVDDPVRRFDLVIMDTAPTGHALRLLETPALVHEWTRTLMTIVLKYGAVAGVGTLGAELLQLARSLGRLQALLRDPARAQFVVVSRAAQLPRLETKRLLASLRRLRMHVTAIVIDAVGRGECARCRRMSAQERREIAATQQLLGDDTRRRRVVLAPVQVPPPSGRVRLERWYREWR